MRLLSMHGQALARLGAVLAVLAGTAQAADTDPKPVPKGGPRALAVIQYNAGVVLMLDRKFAEAQARFEAALAHDETLAEAHNNLAFSLRRQGATRFERALGHYNRAIALEPRLGQAYMYRGVLFLQMGDSEAAMADYHRLLALDAKLAMRLHAAIHAGEDDVYDGLAPQLD